jgi:hypothetical protein
MRDFPSEESERHLETWVNRVELEQQIEKEDPITVDDALARVVKDVDYLFESKEASSLRSHFFSDISEAAPPSCLSDVESRWMTRWILTGPEGTKRRVDQWSQLIGFTGEYLVLPTMNS